MGKNTKDQERPSEEERVNAVRGGANAPATEPHRIPLGADQESTSFHRLNDAFILKRNEVKRACPTFEKDRSLHATLRSETRRDHREIDHTLSRFDLANPASYREFLSVHLDALDVLAGYCGPLERQEIDALVACLCDDLDLKRARDAEGPINLVGSDPAAQAGVAYVIRGSRLGAPFLLDRVASGLPKAYLTHLPALPWLGFIESLALLNPSPATAALHAVPSAKAAFHVFATAAAISWMSP